MSEKLSILDPENREFDEKILKAIAGKFNLSEDFVTTAIKLVDKNNRSLILGSLKESVPITIVIIAGLWGMTFYIMPELFQSQSDPLFKTFGYLVLISASLYLAWACFESRIPKIKRGRFEDELDFAEKTLKPMIDNFLSTSDLIENNPPAAD
jgi:hypothetical protein